MKKIDEVCENYLAGRCRYGDQCRRIHQGDIEQKVEKLDEVCNNLLEERCRFGDMLVAARRTSASRVECVAPSAEDAGAALDVRPATRADLLAAVTLYGGASAIEADAATATAVADGSYASSPG